MTRLIASAELVVSPDYSMFGIVDSIPNFEERPPVPGSSPDGWLGRGRSHILVATGQGGLGVGLRLESWDSEPPALDDEPEVSGTADLHIPSGNISVDLITQGWEHEVLTLPAPGAYHFHIGGYGLERASRSWEELVDRYEEFSDAELATEYERRAGQERYTARFWQVR